METIRQQASPPLIVFLEEKEPARKALPRSQGPGSQEAASPGCASSRRGVPPSHGLGAAPRARLDWA
eukprot:8326057-Pyramimonas_sp.AAC.1